MTQTLLIFFAVALTVCSIVFDSVFCGVASVILFSIIGVAEMMIGLKHSRSEIEDVNKKINELNGRLEDTVRVVKSIIPITGVREEKDENPFSRGSMFGG